jgi:hypothetical protein
MGSVTNVWRVTAGGSESLRRFRELQLEAELQLQPSASLEQLETLRSGRLDAGFVNFSQNPVVVEKGHST